MHLAGVRKLRQRFVGPFKVLQRVGGAAYRLDLQGRFLGVHNVFHVSQLKPFIPGGSSSEPPPPVEVDGQEHFEVEALLKHRKRGRKLQFLVRWLGYS